MKPTQTIAIALFVCLLFLKLSRCSAGAETIVRPATPIENPILRTFNGLPGIFVRLRMENGKEYLFQIDTGRPNTTLDKSLEPLLGNRLDSSVFFEPLIVKGGISRAGVYKAPKLYLGNTLLLTNPKIYTFNWQQFEPGIMGVLGMDCLRHYCVQFDFAHDKILLLNPDHLNTSELGTRIPLTLVMGLLVARADCFGAGKMYFCPDTGEVVDDAILKSVFFHRQLKNQKPAWSLANGFPVEMAGFTNRFFADKAYTDLAFGKWFGSWPAGDLVGLPFLERHLVTFDFPNRAMYLKRETPAPRFDDVFQWGEAVNYFCGLINKRKLPGISTNDWVNFDGPGSLEPTNFPLTITFTMHKLGTPHWIELPPRIRTFAANGGRVVHANNAMAGCDPAPGSTKKLRIDYSVGKLRRMAMAIEGQTITLPAGAQIIGAYYGSHYGSRVDPSHLNAHLDDSTYHYTVIKNSQDEVWHLQKTWRTDKKGRTIEQYTCHFPSENRFD